MTFSGALVLTDLNDFITPSQACIKPVEEINKPEVARKEIEPGAAASEIMIDGSGGYYEVSQGVGASGGGKRLEQAQISLNDCLACSGCITSAESVLITLQSHEEVLNFLESNSKEEEGKRKIPVISIAPQVLASLAASISASASSSTTITPQQTLRRLRVFLKQNLGFAHVFDTTFARELALREHVKEFLERREKARRQAESGKENQEPDGKNQYLPMLASACPGWICYAEKTHGEMLPFIANTKSPQQVMGTLVKEWMGTKWGKRPDEIYHVCVMPCYDKKLEASRSDFYNEIYATRDVDCVVTTGELDVVLRDKGWDLSIPVDGEMDIQHELLPELIGHPGTSSGSYLHAIINHLKKTSEKPLELSVKQIRNADYEEYELREESGPVVFKGAKCYGFRNLQNVVRKVGRESGVRVGMGAAGKLGGRMVRKKDKEEGQGHKIEYIEVMACPGGCVNGGGQMKAVGGGEWGEAEVRWGNREWTKRVETVYWLSGNDEQLDPELLREIDGTGLGLRTSYRAVESNVVGLAVKW
ncbi:iron hydrogenase [Dendrothele bispora CBS 962.96]|uniref:Cytosolic Fe-S cluster assembly factor NAR1 n=1 Tax=Dendrothele bispora (strain CBS 962.96) TaxID=1314807 RepID=A0A4S8MPS6_DENBC|nr:iron hydrogenase [Dendrothele bispora CBS 962.96]